VGRHPPLAGIVEMVTENQGTIERWEDEL